MILLFLRGAACINGSLSTFKHRLRHGDQLLQGTCQPLGGIERGSGPLHYLPNFRSEFREKRRQAVNLQQCLEECQPSHSEKSVQI